MTHAIKSLHPKRFEAMERYIASEKSDPFVRARVYSHTFNGVAGFTLNGEDAFYSADEAVEERYYDSSDVRVYYPVTVYRNLRRP